MHTHALFFVFLAKPRAYIPSPLSLSPPLPLSPQQLLPYITVQGSGKQQHSYPSHSMHFVFPGSVPAGFVIEEVEVVGMTALTGVEVVEVEHMVAGLVGVKR